MIENDVEVIPNYVECDVSKSLPLSIVQVSYQAIQMGSTYEDQNAPP